MTYFGITLSFLGMVAITLFYEYRLHQLQVELSKLKEDYQNAAFDYERTQEILVKNGIPSTEY